MAYSQSWNSVLKFIKRKLGTGVNLLEMSDEEIIEGLDEDVLSLFSQYSPLKRHAVVNYTHKIPKDVPGDPIWRYRIPKKSDEFIVDVLECIHSENDRFSSEIFDENYQKNSYGDIIDVVISNSYSDISRSLSTRNTWEFIEPDIIVFDKEVDNTVIVYNVPHKSPQNIKPDLFQLIFKPLCLGNVQQWLAAKRSKYENVATPFGQININWQKLETDGEANIQKAEEKLNMLPPDKLIEVSV